MGTQLETLIQAIESARTQLTDIKQHYVSEPDKLDHIDDVEMALGWALKKLNQVRSE
jgi:hypothetical protein